MTSDMRLQTPERALAPCKRTDNTKFATQAVRVVLGTMKVRNEMFGTLPGFLGT